MADEPGSMENPWASKMMSVMSLMESFSVINTRMEEFQRTGVMTAEMEKEITEATNNLIKVLGDLGIKLKDVSEKGVGLSNVLAFTGKTFIDLSNNANQFANTFVSAMSKLTYAVGGPWGKAVGSGLELLNQAISAYDKVQIAQRQTIYAQTQLGLNYGNVRDQVEKTSVALREAANRWGFLREEAAKIGQQMTGQGFGAHAGMSERGVARGLGRDLPQATEAVMQAHRGYNLSLELGGRAMTQLGTVYDVEGRRFKEIMGSMIEIGGRSGLGKDRYIETLTQLNEQTKVYGGNLAGVIGYTASYSEQLRKGTLSLENIVKISTPGAVSNEALGFMISTIQQRNPGMAKGLGLTGDMITDIVRMQTITEGPRDKIRRGEQMGPEDMSKLTWMQTALRSTAEQMAGTGRGERFEFMAQQVIDQVLKTHIPLAREAGALLKGGTENLKKFLEAGVEKDPAKRLEEAANKMFDAYKTSGEAFVKEGEMFRDMVKEGGDYIRQAGKDFLDMITGEGKGKEKQAVMAGAWANMSGTAGDLFSHAMFSKAGVDEGQIAAGGLAKQRAAEARFGHKRRQGGGFVPETDLYMLHAGENVSRPGEGGGGLTLNLGGMNVSVASGGNVRGQISEAFDKMKAEAVREVERRWEAANLAG